MRRHEPLIDTFLQHREELRRFFRTTGRGNVSVEDLVQDVYLELTRYPPREPVRDPSAYLFKVAWHLLAQAIRRAKLQPVTHSTSLQEVELRSDDDPAAELGAEQQLIHLLGELPSLYGAVLILNRRDGLNYAEISQHLNISVSQVRRYLGRALAHLSKSQWHD